ncbi:MAG: hypothetical protein LBD29_06420 [Treponema sp.]|jgi:hypothetical protein|nr:hypothetical protein [Treponema sp.]
MTPKKREDEAQIGETVLACGLGRYIQGWDGLDSPLRVLLIAAAGGFRFHHFYQENRLEALCRITAGWEDHPPKTIFIPKKQLITAELQIEKSWWKQLFFAQSLLLIIRWFTEQGVETALAVETEKTSALPADRIQKLIKIEE